jgi:3-oxoacyl-[acyl-carrier-protein] synthase-3
MKAKISYIDYYFPLVSEGIETLKNDNPLWEISKIFEKTGIKKRYISDPKETSLDLAYAAGKKVLVSSGLTQSINLLILVTQSPEYFLPSGSCILQDRLGLKKETMAFDINLGCSGYVYALSVAGSLIESKVADTALIICSDTYTKYILKHDRTCRPLFSDAAAATILERSDYDSIKKFDFGTDGSGFDKLIVKDGGFKNPNIGTQVKPTIEMQGSNVFLFTMKEIPKTVTSLLEKNGMFLEDIDLVIFHQASKFVIESLVEKLSINKNKVFNNYASTGNTVSASIPIAIKDALDEKKLKSGDMILIIGFGVGLSWGATILEWGS